MWLISIFEIQRIPEQDSFIVNIIYKLNKSDLLFLKSIAHYRIQYDIFLGKTIVASNVIDSSLKEGFHILKISLSFPYDKKYKVNFRAVDLNANANILDTTFMLYMKKQPIIIGDIITDREKYSSSDTLVNLKIPLYSTMSDSVQIKLSFENENRVNKLNYTKYLNQGYNELDINLNIKDLGLDRYEGKILIAYKKFKAEQKFKFYKLGLFDMTKKELDNLVFALNYLYSGEFNIYLKKYKDLKSAWDRFWEDKDPTPNTKLNEDKELFLQRYKYVIENYAKRGKINDMGLIYLKHGPPDYIEKSEFNLYDRPYQIWYYESLGLKFVFVDKYGTGDYELAPISWYNEFR
ncbi:MAG: GWxTD domain-containing protein [candidate division WOR-3 bacterium]|nr:GWxTD domain-containing protein [candidate division WOR-3 bacterium]MDW8149867.1 GWxTD domain-containing protein [candidate division WOR-3 bacterium]